MKRWLQPPDDPGGVVPMITLYVVVFFGGSRGMARLAGVHRGGCTRTAAQGGKSVLGRRFVA